MASSCNHFKAFFTFTKEKTFQLLRKFAPRPPAQTPPTPVAATLDPETPAPPPPQNNPRLDQHPGQQHVDWSIVIGICLVPALERAKLPTQTSSFSPMLSHMLSLGVIVALTFIIVAMIMNPKHPKLARVLERIGIFFAFTTFFVAITIPLPVWLKCIAWIIFAVSLLVTILIYHCL